MIRLFFRQRLPRANSSPAPLTARRLAGIFAAPNGCGVFLFLRVIFQPFVLELGQFGLAFLKGSAHIGELFMIG